MKANLSWMSEKFEEFNKTYFNNVLKDIKLGIEDSPYNALGRCDCNVKKKYEGKIGKYIDNKQLFFIRTKKYVNVTNYNKVFNMAIYIDDIEAPEYVLEDILMHEMLHAYCYANGKACKHSGMFRNYGGKICKMSNGKYEITTYLKPEYVMLIK